MKTKELEVLSKSKSVSLLVTDPSKFTDEVYGEKGMVCTLLSYENDSDGVSIITVNWNDNEDINIPLESSNWNVSPDVLGTMKEADQFPANGIEELYLMSEEDSGFELFEESHSFKCISDWRLYGSDMDYVSWLELSYLAPNIVASRKSVVAALQTFDQMETMSPETSAILAERIRKIDSGECKVIILGEQE